MSEKIVDSLALKIYLNVLRLLAREKELNGDNNICVIANRNGMLDCGGEGMEKYANPFEFQEDDPIIACVGDNGGTFNMDIKNGFQRTVEILIGMLNQENEVEDILVYPIVYNARHSIELSLKIIIEQLWKIQELKGIKKSEEVISQEKKKIHTHDIKALYEIIEQLGGIDRRIPDYYKNIEDLIKIYYFDKEGDAFKYESDKEEQPHMIQNGISHISVNTLGKQFNLVMNLFDNMIYFLEDCIREYRFNTFTKNLSRKDIKDISILIPERRKWGESSFDKTKEEIKKKYSISNKEFSNALNIIQRHKEFCVNIGCEIPYKEINEDELKEYAVLVYESIIEERKNGDGGERLQPDLIEIQRKAKVWSKYRDTISTLTLNLLFTFAEMSQAYNAVEKIEEIFSYISGSNFDVMYMIRKLKKKDTCKKVLVGMRKCGQISYEKALVELLKQQGLMVEIKESDMYYNVKIDLIE